MFAPLEQAMYSCLLMAQSSLIAHSADIRILSDKKNDAAYYKKLNWKLIKHGTIKYKRSAKMD